MKQYANLVRAYIRAQGNSWAPSTMKSEEQRLLGLAPEVVLKNDGEALYKYLIEERNLKPYSAKTTMTRAGAFLQWAMESGNVPMAFNQIKLYMKRNARLFKRVYQPKRDGLDFDETLKRIQKIADPEAREKAAQLLRLGLRWEESFTLKDGYVIGKGNAKRFVRTAVPEDEQVKYTKSYYSFRNSLAEVGLKPHDLRKAHATLLANSGAHIGDLMAMMGWSNAQTAASYVQSVRERELSNTVKDAMKKGIKKNASK